MVRPILLNITVKKKPTLINHFRQNYTSKIGTGFKKDIKSLITEKRVTHNGTNSYFSDHSSQMKPFCQTTERSQEVHGQGPATAKLVRTSKMCLLLFEQHNDELKHEKHNIYNNTPT